MGHKDLRLGKIVYILVFYNISFFWLLPLDGFQYIFLLRDSENDLYNFRCPIFELGGKTKHLMTGLRGNSEVCFPETLN